MVHGRTVIGAFRTVNSLMYRVAAFIAPRVKALLTAENGYVLAAVLLIVTAYAVGRLEERRIHQARQAVILAKLKAQAAADPAKKPGKKCNSCLRKKAAPVPPLKPVADPAFTPSASKE